LAAHLVPPSFLASAVLRAYQLLLPCLLMIACPVLARRPLEVVPSGPDIVIERLPKGYARLMPSTGIATPAASIELVGQWLAAAARTGDARLAARAEGLLMKFPSSDRRPEVLRARAFSAQHRHDFASAVKLLDTLVAQQPRDGTARLARAQINLVQGRIDRARADCTALVLGVDADDGMLCAASLSLRTGDYKTAADLIERWLAPGPADDGSRRYALVMRGEIAARAGDRKADGWFRRALALDVDDVRTLAAYARYLRSVGRNQEVETLLADKVDNDGLQLQRTLALHVTEPARAKRLIVAQSRRYATAYAVGIESELRDEAEFLLTLRNRPQAALALAQRNFAIQRDHEDVDILRRAAIAAHRPEALQPLRAWAASQKLRLLPLEPTLP
jgi:predicted Zn-dependent protease